MGDNRVTRRDFIESSVKAGAALTTAAALGKPAFGFPANERINVGLIGCGGRGMNLLHWATEVGAKDGNAKVVAVSDVYQRRLREASEFGGAKQYLDYRELIARPDIDAVIIATPDHWHARMSIEAMQAGKDVYCEKPMTHTVEEAKQVHHVVQKTGRVFQVGSQTTSNDQWWKARQMVTEGIIGTLVESQGSYHRNSIEGEWNWDIDATAGPEGKGDDFIDWAMWLGPAPKRAYDADRFFRFRKYWDYSGGIATDLFYHVMAPLQICWGEAQFPWRVSGTGGRWIFNKDGREVPDTFMLTADFPKGHSLVLSSSMANNTHIPGLVRGYEGTIMMVPDGQFEGEVNSITVTPQPHVAAAFYKKHGTEVLVIPTEKRPDHMQNFFECMRTRQKPVLDSNTAYKAMVTIGMSYLSYQKGVTLYFDPASETVVEHPIAMKA